MFTALLLPTTRTYFGTFSGGFVHHTKLLSVFILRRTEKNLEETTNETNGREQQLLLVCMFHRLFYFDKSLQDVICETKKPKVAVSLYYLWQCFTKTRGSPVTLNFLWQCFTKSRRFPQPTQTHINFTNVIKSPLLHGKWVSCGKKVKVFKRKSLTKQTVKSNTNLWLARFTNYFMY